MSQQVDILALGVASPLGLSSRATIAALRAGFNAHEEIDEVEDPMGETVTACRMTERELGSDRVDRATFFAGHALAEVLSWRPWTVPPAVFLTCPESKQARGFDVARLWASLREGAPSVPLPATPTFVPHGRAGVFHAIAKARDPLLAGAVDLALVGGADSLVTTDELRQLSSENALLGKSNPDGLVPGEGAAFFLLARRGNRDVFATIESLALGREPESRSMGGPPRATGLSHAFAQLRANDTARAEVVVSALPPQRWWAREFSHAYLRNAALMPEPLATRTASVGLGDLGAAAGGFALGVALWELHPLVARRGVTVVERALVYGCADEGTLGACLLRSPRSIAGSS